MTKLLVFGSTILAFLAGIVTIQGDVTSGLLMSGASLATLFGALMEA